MSRTTLIECSPRLPDGTTMTLRLVDRSPRAAAYLGAQWLPHVTELPGFESSIGFDGQRFGAAPSPQIGALGFALAPEIRSSAGWVWRDAAITIRQAAWPLDGSNPADGDFATSWVCDAASIAVNDGVARVELIDRGQKLRVPLATLKFGTTGVALLDAAAAARDRAAGQVVPVAFGRCFTLPGLLVDRVNNIWLFAASAAASVQAFYDGGVPFTIGAARASLAALQGTAPAAGAVDYCLSDGGLFLARPADRPTYPFTADATFGSAALGTVASSIVGGRLPFRSGVVAALNGLGLGDVGLYIDDEASVAEALDRLLAGLGIFWKVRADGTIDAKRIGWGSPVASFAAHQRHAPSRLRIILPTGRRQLGYATNNRVHGEGEIARILLATDLAYADGTLIEALKPAEAGATEGAPNGTPVGAYTDAANIAPAVLVASTTAQWPNVTGTGRPADGADVTANAVPNLPQGDVSIGSVVTRGQSWNYLRGTWVALSNFTASSINLPPNAAFWRLLTNAADGSTAVAVSATSGSASFAPTATADVRCGPTGDVVISCNLTVSAEPGNSASYLGGGKWQREITPGSGTYTDVMSEALSGSIAPGGSVSLAVSTTVSGLTPGSLHRFQLALRRAGAGPGTDVLNFNGIANLQGQ